MKKQVLFLLITGVMSLTGCDSLFNHGMSSSSSSSSSSIESSIDIHNDDELYKHTMKYTYSDYTSNNYYRLDSTPSNGNPKLLVIPVWFTDSSTYIPTESKAKVRDDISIAYFGTNEQTGWRSVSTYYNELSHGAVNLTGVVSEWYECEQPSSDFYTETSSTCDLVSNAVSWYKSNHGDSPLLDYDSDADGYLDGVMLIYAAPNYNDMKNTSATNMWAYCYWMQSRTSPDVDDPTPNAFFWASYDFMYDANNKVGNYSYGTCTHTNIDTHTYIHEMGHVFGLSDYYDYSENNFSPAGGFSMQDYNVGSHDPYSVMSLGWAKPYVPTKSQTILINDFQSSGDLILLSNSFSDSPFDEYFLLELYTPTGLNELDSIYRYDNYPQGPLTTGIRLWHVDDRLAYVNSYSESFSADKLTTEPTSDKKVTHALSNTYYKTGGSSNGRISVLGQSYANFNQLQLIRKSTNYTYRPSTMLTATDLFVEGDTFTMETYKKQFYKSGKLNSNETFNWSFTVDKILNNQAAITVTKLA